jgi:outer membrane protein
VEEIVSLANVIRVSILSVAGLGLTSLPLTQTPAPAGAPAAVKVGIINMQEAISSSAEGKQAASELEAQFLPRKKELDTLNAQIAGIQSHLDGAATLAVDERDRLTIQGNRLNSRLQRQEQEYQDDLTAAQQERVSEIGRKMSGIINRFAADGNYTVILDSSSQTSPVLYATKTIDITPEVIRLYDQSNPLKNAVAAPTPKPSTPAPSKP